MFHQRISPVFLALALDEVWPGLCGLHVPIVGCEMQRCAATRILKVLIPLALSVCVEAEPGF